jgi:hypothetical protein
VGKGRLEDPARAPKPGAVLLAAPGDHRLDAARPQLAAVLVVVIAAVGEHAIGALARPPAPATYRSNAINERQQLRDIVALPACQRDRQRDTGAVHQEMMLGAAARTVDR